jgi:2,3-bisphosphoglycerate-dependent phosphoglycerate mutase
VRPPALAAQEMRAFYDDPRYMKVPHAQLPVAESLTDTVTRVLPLWKESIAPALQAGKRVLISAHGNSLRALIKYLDAISDQEISKFNIPNGIPLVYELDTDLQPIRHTYLKAE